METIRATIELPKSILSTCKARESNLPTVVKTSFILELYREGLISLGKAGELLGMSREEMLGVFKEKGISLNYDAADLEEDRKTWRVSSK